MNGANAKSVLTSLLEAVDAVVDAAATKQGAVIYGSANDLKEAVAIEETATRRLREAESRRVAYIYLHGSNANDRISDIANVKSEEEREALAGIEKKIAATARRAHRINQRNMLVIEQSKQFVSQVIAAVVGQTPRALVDRKA